MGNNSYKHQLAKRIRDKVNYPLYVIEDIIDAMGEAAAETILDTGEFHLPNIVTIKCYEKQPRRYWDPDRKIYGQTDGKGYKLQSFPAGKLKSKINEGVDE